MDDEPLQMIPTGHVFQGQWEVKFKLGGGGFGDVFLCHDRKRDKDVAVKVEEIQTNVSCH